ncbi:ABC transporter substrate-binding protein [Cohnella nanjingensis]|uniref:ABC transporter substrate-binding protein n=1 Tax=Cohnella nanjingensis TaxID=1387779 RepID=A0A7X0VIW0_9BACL|nr:ABC transporter substrate-binding protein [Cohnella nanjingensis]MBB6675356.1 ABC transporter substrate-binding protein [Cohnella nanjingensis]
MKRYLWGFVLAAMLAVMAACGAKDDAPEASGSGAAASPSATASASASSPAASPEGKETQYPITVQDATGQSFTFDKAPERIVSTSPAETEMLFALGLNDQVVGVSDYDNYPEEATTKTKVGGVTKPNEEAIVGLTPDLVITGISMKEDVVAKFRDLKLNVYKTDAKTLDDVMNGILQIGVITNRQAQAEAVVASMKADVQKVKDAVGGLKQEEKKKVYVEFSPGWTVGKGEFMDEIITLAGGENVAGDTEGWNQINEETIVQRNPDVILFTQGVKDDQSGKTLEELIRGRSGWDKIQAIKDNRIVGLDQDLLSRPGPRLTQGLLAVAKAVYPDLVK